MLSYKQGVIAALVGVAFWVLVAVQVRYGAPRVPGLIEFLIAFPAGWLSVWIVKRCVSLRPEQLPVGVLIAGGTAMMIDGVVLRWVPQVYGAMDLSLFAAWLLWGYGVALVIAVFMARPPARVGAGGSPAT